MIICKINPKTPFHLGLEDDLEISEHYIHSDTLFSGICNAFRLLYGSEGLNDFLESYKNNPVFFSSAFPYIKDILLFPLPKSLDLSKHTISHELKKFQKIEFVSEIIFKDIITGKDISEYLKEENLIQKGMVLLTKEEKEKYNILNIWNEREIPRSVIDRETHDLDIYHFKEVSFLKSCGLFFLIDFNNSEYKEKIIASIRLLGDEGIGGDRSYGKGLFSVEFRDYSLKAYQKGNNFITLSLYYPQDLEMDKISFLDSYYELILRKGWIYSQDGKSMRRKTIRMFSEGSVFKYENLKEPLGRLVDVTPEEFFMHKIYRYGYAFSVRVWGNEGER